VGPHLRVRGRAMDLGGPRPKAEGRLPPPRPMTKGLHEVGSLSHWSGKAKDLGDDGPQGPSAAPATPIVTLLRFRGHECDFVVGFTPQNQQPRHTRGIEAAKTSQSCLRTRRDLTPDRCSDPQARRESPEQAPRRHSHGRRRSTSPGLRPPWRRRNRTPGASIRHRATGC